MVQLGWMEAWAPKYSIKTPEEGPSLCWFACSLKSFLPRISFPTNLAFWFAFSADLLPLDHSWDLILFVLIFILFNCPRSSLSDDAFLSLSFFSDVCL